jgi:hypothetical protein
MSRPLRTEAEKAQEALDLAERKLARKEHLLAEAVAVATELKAKADEVRAIRDYAAKHPALLKTAAPIPDMRTDAEWAEHKAARSPSGRPPNEIPAEEAKA